MKIEHDRTTGIMCESFENVEPGKPFFMSGQWPGQAPQPNPALGLFIKAAEGGFALNLDGGEVMMIGTAELVWIADAKVILYGR